VIKNVFCCSCKVPGILVMPCNETLIFPRQIFEKYSDIKLHDVPSSGSPSCCMLTGRRSAMHDEVNSKSDVWLTVHRNSVWIRKTN